MRTSKISLAVFIGLIFFMEACSKINQNSNPTSRVQSHVLASGSSGSNIYIAQNGVGVANGADCADAYAISFFNNSVNWGTSSGQIGPGTTVHLCSGTYSFNGGASNALVFQGSGTASNPITLVADQGAVTITAPYWSSFIINLNGNNYITLNGNNNATLEATANGTNFANHQDYGIGIGGGSNSSNVTIESWTISNLYVKTCTEPDTNCTDENGGNTSGIQFWAGSNDIVEYNTISNVHWAIVVDYGGLASTSTNLQVHHNTISGMDHGVIFGDQGDSSVLTSSNCSSAIHDNDFSNMQPWDDAADDFHHDAIHIWANNTSSGSSYTGVCTYNNYFHGDAGMRPSGIFTMESFGKTNYIFNNVINLSGSSQCADGAIALFVGSGANGLNQTIVNNTISPGAHCTMNIGLGEQTGAVLENNLSLSNTQSYVYTNGAAGEIGTADYNFYQSPAGANPFFGPSGCASGASFSSWQGTCGFDTHGQQTTLSLNSDFTLPSGSAAIGKGKNLASLGITALGIGAPQTFGVSGICGTGCVQRSPSGTWDVGAYPYNNSGSPTPTPRATPVPTPIPTATPKPTPSSTPSPTPIATPRPTPIPSPTPLASPTPLPSPTPTPTSGPTTTIISPVNGAVVPVSSSVNIQATAKGSQIAYLDFLVNGTVKYRTSSPPYTYTWQVPSRSRRTYQLRTKAYNENGTLLTISSDVYVTSK